MKSYKILSSFIIISVLVFEGCSLFKKSGRDTIAGTATSSTVDISISEVAGNPAYESIINSAIGGSAGLIISRYMDKQAEELRKALPDALIKRAGEGITLELSGTSMFALNKPDLLPEAEEKLLKLSTVFVNYPETKIEVQGYTDDTGTESYNKSLSEKRATSVSNYLIKNGIDTERLTTKGYGEMLPKYDNTTEEGRAKNRRVEFVITANEKLVNEAETEAEK